MSKFLQIIEASPPTLTKEMEKTLSRIVDLSQADSSGTTLLHAAWFVVTLFQLNFLLAMLVIIALQNGFLRTLLMLMLLTNMVGHH